MVKPSNNNNNNKKDVDVFSNTYNSVRPAHILDDFVWTSEPDPHAIRKEKIIKAHPEVRKLFVHEPLTPLILTCVVLLQFCCAYLIKDSLFTWKFWLLAYVVGGTCHQNLFLGIHELSHFLGFKTRWHNKLFSCFANLPMVIPYCSVFRLYHMEHHKFMGVEGIDVDLPTKMEAAFFSNTLSKAFFVSSYLLFYCIRPIVIRPVVFDIWQLVNLAIQLSFDVAVWYFFGLGPLVYLFVSTYLAGSLHPCASHFIAEHHSFLTNTETYSYYGWLNLLCFNVGYHNEHHDFPNVPWSKLPELRRIAHEFYDDLPQHDSWPKAMIRFILDPNVSMMNRIVRKDTQHLAEKPCGYIRSGKED